MYGIFASGGLCDPSNYLESGAPELTFVDPEESQPDAESARIENPEESQPDLESTRIENP